MSVFRPILLLVISIVAGMALAGWRSPLAEKVDSASSAEESIAAGPSVDPATSQARPSLTGLAGWELFRALPQFLRNATEQELEALAGEWEYRLQTNKYPEIVWKLVLPRWLELDPEGALRCERRLDSENLTGYCYRTWIDQDYEAAWVSALAESDPPYTLLLDAVAKHDPELGLQWVEENIMLLYPFMEAWGGEDVNAAIQAVDRFPAYHRPGLLSAIVRSYAKVAPREAVGLVGDIGSPHYHYYAALSALTELANVDPNAAQSALEKLPHGETRVAALEAIAKERARKNPEAALAWQRDWLPVPTGVR